MNTLLQLLQILQLHGIRNRLDAMRAPPPMPTVDCSPEPYVTGKILGPPPQVEDNPCSRFVTEDELDQMIADKAVARMEAKFNKPGTS
jgi:hypothetical protein